MIDRLSTPLMRKLAGAAFIVYALVLVTLTHWPRLELGTAVPRPDIYAHIAAFGLWTALLMATGWLGRPLSARSILLSTIAGVCMGAVDEASQGLPGINRTVDSTDLVANTGGVLLAALIASVIAFFTRSAHPPVDQPGANDEPESDGAFIGHARTFAALTMGSRVLGLARDALIALVLGASATASSFFTAFVIPNVFRRLFGEGALTAAFIPEYTRLSQTDPNAAARFASLTTAALAVGLGGLVIIAEIGLAIVLSTLDQWSSSREVVLLTMIMVPFMPLVCITALLGAMLQVHGRFSAQAGSPILLNALLISAACSAGVILEWSMSAVAIALAVAVTIAGVLQLLWCLLDLQGVAGWTRDNREALPKLRLMLRRMIPVLIGLGTVQIGVLIDALIAGLPVVMGTPEGESLVLFASESGEGGVVYPLDTASAAVLYFGQRLYHLPLGVFAVAIATAVFPALARATNDPARFTETLRIGLRTSLMIAVPAALGLVLVADPLVAAVYGATGSGGLDADSAARVKLILLAYTPAIIAASITQVLTRSYYARDDMRTPMRIGIAVVLLNIGLNIVLIWPLAETGLAVATSITAWIQTIALLVLARRRVTGEGETIIDRSFMHSVFGTVAIALAMGAAVFIVGAIWPWDASGRLGALALLMTQCGIGALTYVAVNTALGRNEMLSLLLGNRKK